jgi:hypothetical protein
VNFGTFNSKSFNEIDCVKRVLSINLLCIVTFIGASRNYISVSL